LTRILPLIIHILQEPATATQINEMLQANRFYIKTAVDIRHRILAGGGEMHSDCETILLENGRIAFRCDRLSVRLERLSQNFLQMASLSLDEFNGEAVLEIIRESKVFLELTAIDLDVDNAFELAQIQRQLSKWHIHWWSTWTSDSSRLEISTLSQNWANRMNIITMECKIPFIPN
jgi:hypothetical protein